MSKLGYSIIINLLIKPNISKFLYLKKKKTRKKQKDDKLIVFICRFLPNGWNKQCFENKNNCRFQNKSETNE